MASSYKTPGVYVEEITKFPPSVAEVASAIPAFIGYTEKALINGVQWSYPSGKPAAPVKVTSLLEYEQIFGGPPTPDINAINFDSNYSFQDVEINTTFYLYDSLKAFYDNGGGVCYIVSIGNYDVPSIDKSAFEDGVSEIALVDEPTLLLSPDAVLLDPNTNDFYTVQNKMMEQCHNLMDRFSILDLRKTDPLGVDFKDNIGIKYLSYAAAYTPWLQVSSSFKPNFGSISGVLYVNNVSAGLDQFTTDTDIKLTINELADLYDDYEKISNSLNANALRTTVATVHKDYATAYQAVKQDFLTDFAAGGTNSLAKFKNVLNFLYKFASTVDNLVDSQAGDDLANSAVYANVVSNITSANKLKDIYTYLIGLENLLVNHDTITGGTDGQTYLKASREFLNGLSIQQTDWNTIFGAGVTNTITPPGGSPALTQLLTVSPSVTPVGYALKNNLNVVISNANLWLDDKFNSIVQILNSIADFASSSKSTKEIKLGNDFPLYKSILNKVSSAVGEIPPSGAIVGLIASVDRDRGVWKAPANISLSGVNAVTKLFKANELEDLNVDAVAGKSINAIIPRTGRGKAIVMGSRTLAGNDNEWRYVPVRRLFIFVEENVKKSTEWAVFEPNDANTWIRVQSMIENYLFNLWRQGALAGAKPEHAYYVSCGIGKTMTAQDILNGNLIVEIGMAAVRPAEFIVLKFSHKLQES